MIAGCQNRRNGSSFPDGGPRVLRMLQEAFREAFLNGRGGIAKDAWDQPDGGIQDGLRCDFAAREHEIPKRDFFDVERFPDVVQWLAWVLPMTHLIAVMRPLMTGIPLEPLAAALHIAYVIGLGGLAFVLAFFQLRRRMFD